MPRVKKRFFLSLLILSLFLIPAFQSAGLEISAEFDFGNLGFDPDRDASATGFSGLDWIWGGSVELSHNFADTIVVKGGFHRDPVLRNVAYAMIYYKLEYFSMGLGVIQGVQNSSGEVLKPGIASSVRLDIPGVAFAAFLFDYSLGGQPVDTADYVQSRNEFAIGFYARNVICTLSVQSKQFFMQEAATREVVDSLVRYLFEADVFRKNSPYRLVFTFGYQTMQKEFLDGSASPPVHTLNSLFTGAELDVDVTPYLTLMLGLDATPLTIGQDQLVDLRNPGPGGFLFNARAGFSLDFETLKARR